MAKNNLQQVDFCWLCSRGRKFDENDHSKGKICIWNNGFE